MRNSLRPYEYEFTGFACGYNVIKRKDELSKIQRKRMIFFNRLKYAEHKIFCICIGVYKIYEGIDFVKIYEALSTLKKIKDISIEKYRDKNKNSDFEQNYFSGTSTGIYKIGHNSIRSVNWLAFYDRSYYENFLYYFFMVSILICLSQISEP